ncbi:MAG TPA: hypothetical protein DET40_08355 [Lentisphaeria bacterium]|nr:MAG: hypothetical protein A2X45_25870 [Lentisphaerae bacterium GWF2_50_93]HCE43545.1 hypothetical protein [Lentisphaeria bacterium]
MPQKKILITGASGLIGKLSWSLLGSFPEKYDLYGLDCTTDFSFHAWGLYRKVDIPGSRMTISDISDYKKVSEALAGIDTVIQLAANPSPFAPWEETLSANIQGLHNVFEASRIAGVKRIIYASSIRVSEGYCTFEEPYRSIRDGNFKNVPDKFPLVKPSDPVRPIEAYGASKVFGEALARVYSDVFGISCICLRIGLVSADDTPSQKQAGIWCSHKDISKIIQLCVDAPGDLKYETFYCLSDSSHKWIDTSNLRDILGFVPQDSEDSRKVMLG